MTKISINGVGFTKLTGKKAKALINEFHEATRHGQWRLDQIYERCSFAKHEAYQIVLAQMRRVNGENFWISTYNKMMFTIVYVIVTEEKQYIVKVTPNNQYIAEYKEEE